MVYNYLAVIGFMSVLTIILYIQGETVEMTVGSEATKKQELMMFMSILRQGTRHAVTSRGSFLRNSRTKALSFVK